MTISEITVGSDTDVDICCESLRSVMKLQTQTCRVLPGNYFKNSRTAGSGTVLHKEPNLNQA